VASSSTTTSVNVPPTSTPTQCMQPPRWPPLYHRRRLDRCGRSAWCCDGRLLRASVSQAPTMHWTTAKHPRDSAVSG
jgi:hypothetical protein